jgi:hypothetical protein
MVTGLISFSFLFICSVSISVNGSRGSERGQLLATTAGLPPPTSFASKKEAYAL